MDYCKVSREEGRAQREKKESGQGKKKERRGSGVASNSVFGRAPWWPE
jgi:hypothetical protein